MNYNYIKKFAITDGILAIIVTIVDLIVYPYIGGTIENWLAQMCGIIIGYAISIIFCVCIEVHNIYIILNKQENENKN